METCIQYWNKALLILENNVSTITYSTWISTLKPVDIIGQKMILHAETELFAEKITERLVEKIRSALIESNTGLNDFELHVGDDDEDFLQKKGFATSEAETGSPIEPRFTFDSFVVGQSNKFLYAAAKAVAENPGEAYNPLFIYGSTGLGKTHIMHAIANSIKHNFPSKVILYSTCEKFTNELIDALKLGRLKGIEFRNRYRNVDVLMIDDVQFLAKKQSSQEEFFHTFNELYSQNKQIILSSDCPPGEIALLEERLRTRFEGGLMADVQPPDIETKIAILQRKAEEKKYIINNDVLTYLAENSGDDVRTLEGKLTKVIFASKLHEKPITIELAIDALKESTNRETVEVVTITNIINAVCSFYKISKSDLIGKRKTKEIVEPRQICTYLITELMNLPLVTIGQAIGGRDHTTVIHARDKIAEEIKTSNRLKTEINDLKNIILKK